MKHMHKNKGVAWPGQSLKKKLKNWYQYIDKWTNFI